MKNRDAVKKQIITCVQQSLFETAIQLFKENFGETAKIIEIERKWNSLQNDRTNNVVNRIDYEHDISLLIQSFINIVNRQTDEEMANRAGEEIFISYGWGGESEIVADKIYKAFTEKKFNIIRDKIDLSYKGNIKEFMQKIGEGQYIIVIIGDKYLKSENCMFEMLEIKNNGQIYDRIFPVVLTDAKIYDEIDRIDYLNYWDSKTSELQQKIKTIQNPVGIGKVIEKINQYNDIRRVIDDITDMLRNMNTLTLTMHNESNYEYIIKSIEQNLISN